jgi:hypothetical protein
LKRVHFLTDCYPAFEGAGFYHGKLAAQNIQSSDSGRCFVDEIIFPRKKKSGGAPFIAPAANRRTDFPMRNRFDSSFIILHA